MKKTLSSRLPREVLASALLFLLGLSLGNPLLIVLSLIPIFYVALSTYFAGPSQVTITGKEAADNAWVGDRLVVEREVLAEKGMGVLVVGEGLPEHFRLEKGSNLQVFWKGNKPLNERYGYEVTATRRGIYQTEALRMEGIHFSGLRTAEMEIKGQSKELLIKQRRILIRRIRDPHILSNVAKPVNAVSRSGTRSTDFRELRKYVHGDRFRNINWKATVRLATSEDDPPLVNEYEREGRTTVWVLLDARGRMSLGTNVENAFEHAVAASSALCHFYLDRNCDVGLAVLGREHVLLPEAGRRQTVMVDRMLLEAMVDPKPTSFRETMSGLHGHMEGTTPLVVMVTSVDAERAEDILRAVKILRAQAGRRTQVMVLHLSPYSLAKETEEDRIAASFLQLRDAVELRRLRAAGATVMTWDPARQSLRSLLVATLGRK